MKTIINVECIDQDMIVTNSPVLASGGVHESYIAFKFCSKWDGMTKTAVFYKNAKDVYHALVNEENMCEIPHEVTDSEGTMYFGVFGVLGEVTRTSKVLKYKIKQGAITEALKPSDPTPDIYQQLISKYDSILKNQAEFVADQDALMKEYQETWTKEVETSILDAENAGKLCLDAITALQLEYTDMNGGTPTTEEETYDNDFNGGYPINNS